MVVANSFIFFLLYELNLAVSFQVYILNDFIFTSLLELPENLWKYLTWFFYFLIFLTSYIF